MSQNTQNITCSQHAEASQRICTQTASQYDAKEGTLSGHPLHQRFTFTVRQTLMYATCNTTPTSRTVFLFLFVRDLKEKVGKRNDINEMNKQGRKKIKVPACILNLHRCFKY